MDNTPGTCKTGGRLRQAVRTGHLTTGANVGNALRSVTLRDVARSGFL